VSQTFLGKKKTSVYQLYKNRGVRIEHGRVAPFALVRRRRRELSRAHVYAWVWSYHGTMTLTRAHDFVVIIFCASDMQARNERAKEYTNLHFSLHEYYNTR
jgi:hypothetical protein